MEWNGMECMRMLLFRIHDCMKKVWFEVRLHEKCEYPDSASNRAILMHPYFQLYLFNAVAYFEP